MERKIYEEPRLELLFVEVERGFDASGNYDPWGLPDEDPDFNDFGEF